MHQPLVVDCTIPQPTASHSDASVRTLTSSPTNLSPDSLFSYKHTSPPSSTDSSHISEKCLESISPELRGYIQQTPLIIGDRVLVGPAKRHGTIAYIGPTHFAAGNWAGVVLDTDKGRHDGATHGLRYFSCPPKRGIFCPLDTLERIKTDTSPPNARIRTRNNTPPSVPQATGPDSRRFSLVASNGLVRSQSAKFDCRQFQSIIGTISTATSAPTTSSKLQRSKSDRFTWRRPEWLPPGSHDVRSSGLTPDKEKLLKLSRSKTLPGLNKSQSPQRRKLEATLRKSNSLFRPTFPKPLPHRRDTKPQFSKSLTVLDKRASRKSYGPSCASTSSRSDLRRRVWSENSNKTNSLSDVTTSQQKYNALLKAFAALTMCESKAECLRKSLISSVSKDDSNFHVDCIVSCAQDRLMELQNQLLEVYHARNKVAEELESTKKLYDQLRYACELRKSGHIPCSKTGLFNESRLGQLRSRMAEEFQRTKRLWTEMKKLHQRVQSSNIYLSNNISPHTTAESTAALGDQNPVLPEGDTEDDEAKLREMSEFPDFKLRSPTPVLTEYQLRKLKMTSIQQNHYMALLGKIKVCRSVIHQNLDALFKEQDEIDGLVHRPTLLRAVYEQQVAWVNQTQSSNHRLATELSVIRAEIVHLSSRPVKEAHMLVEKFRTAESASKNSKLHIDFLEKVMQRLKEDINVWKVKVSVKEQRQTILMQVNLRIHQLTQFECKAHSLELEQTQLVESKQRELKSLMDEFDFMSRVWANERQLQLKTNYQLKEKLTNLTDMHLVSKRSGQGWSAENTCYGLEGDSAMTYELFSVLCKEIRRLQTRSANLIDALDTLSSGGCSSTTLESIRVLVHRTSNPKSVKKSPSFLRREISLAISSSAPHLDIAPPKSLVVPRPVFRYVPTTSSAASEKVMKPHPVCIDSRHHSCPTYFSPNGNGQAKSQPSERDIRPTCPVRQLSRTSSPAFGTHLRRRPMSFYIRRSFEPVLEGSIPEADEEQEKEEFL
ncbi:hypothetical protein CRM22_010518 [Opisthorchis felineus]|uniref:CAP-Gly domain-containing protein n=1 Tax=Opisthorchis felineus TaxID=147828 RepID=A0A4S2KXP8_OPIFE|nr:hypothetical protein CRM22_010518 [Opisthorchis felineus]TGZ55033.1 hypothetical protein CRM22_010518 [Opisthorchis felineus]